MAKNMSIKNTNIKAKGNIVAKHVFDVPVEDVWNAWVEPKLVMLWWGPHGFTSPLVKMDFHQGGTSFISMLAPEELGGQEYYNLLTYRKIIPYQSIEYILSFSDKTGNKIDPTTIGMPPDTPKEKLNLVTFKRLAGDRTELTVTEFNWTVGQMMELSRIGLEQTLDKMEKIFTNEPFTNGASSGSPGMP